MIFQTASVFAFAKNFITQKFIHRCHLPLALRLFSASHKIKRSSKKQARYGNLRKALLTFYLHRLMAAHAAFLWVLLEKQPKDEGVGFKGRCRVMPFQDKK